MTVSSNDTYVNLSDNFNDDIDDIEATTLQDDASYIFNCTKTKEVISHTNWFFLYQNPQSLAKLQILEFEKSIRKSLLLQ